MLLIGSTAIKYWYPDFPREPKDKDYIVGNKKGLRSSLTREYLVNNVLKNFKGIATPDIILTLKASHVIGWDINWDKHMFDIQFLLGKGHKIDKKLFYELYSYWNVYHGKNRRSNLVMTAEDFFDNAVDCKYEHDWLHTVLNPVPTYTKVLKDGAEVEVSEEKFNRISFEEKCYLVREEVEVMSWERWPKLDYRAAYHKMLKKFILGHAPLWEGLFIIENYKHLLETNRNHFKILNDATSENLEGHLFDNNITPYQTPGEFIDDIENEKYLIDCSAKNEIAWWRVYQIGNDLYMFSGYYNSYNGLHDMNWNEDVKKVQKVTKSVTVYK